MKGYEQYIEDIKSGAIPSSQYIKLQVERLENFKKRDDMYFDEEAVDNCFAFINCLKHFSGKSAGQSFKLLPWQEWVVSSIVGIKWKATGLRVCRQVYLQMARKQGKSSLIAALGLYFLICDNEASAEVDVLATSRDQARILFDMCQNYAKSIDPKQEALKLYRNYIKMPSTNSFLKLYSSDASKLDGLCASCSVLDEYAAQPNNLLYSVMKSSQATRTQPLMILITTPQFNLESPAYQVYQVGIEILNGIKTDDTEFDFLYTLDPDDDWKDENVWIKSNPSLGATVTYQYLHDQIVAATNDTTQIVPVKTKNIGVWCQAESVWIPQDKVVKVMGEVDLEEYRGSVAYIGVDLSAVQDLTALSIMIPIEDNTRFVFYNWTWLPRETYDTSQNHQLYEAFIQDGDDFSLTPGNVVDYDAVINKMLELRDMFNIAAVYYDKWNSTQWAIRCTELGFNLVPFAQGIGHFNNATKMMTKSILEGTCLIQKSRLVLWQFGNAVLKRDSQGNEKVTKENNLRKVDNIISMTTALGGFYEENVPTEFDIFVL